MRESCARTRRARVSIFAATFAAAFVALEPGRAAEVAVPPRVPLQGFLTDSNGQPINGAVSVQLRLYDSPASTAVLFSETQSVTAVNGVFNAMLGEVTPLPTTLFKSISAYYVGVTFNGDELAPRLRLGSVPYAIHAADGVPSGAVMSFDLTTCPPGWTEYLSGRGRSIVGLNPGGALGGVAGTAYGNLENRTHGHAATTGVDGAHAHTVDPASFTSGSTTVAHTHPVDPPVATASTNTHAHLWAIYGPGNVPAWATYDASGNIKVLVQWGDGMDSAGSGHYPLSRDTTTNELMYTEPTSHNHTVDVASFTSGAASATAHAHAVDVPATTTPSGGSHSHLITVSAAAAGAPYVQLLTCRKD